MRDLHVEISGEGDFTVKTDCAWHVEAKANGTTIVVWAPERDESPGVQVWHDGDWLTIWPVKS